ncbi:alpha/beta fold hydrolase [bacterium]|nr:alpha/beta fold hydrolase [bacterium]
MISNVQTQLVFKERGQGPAIIILHGLFGSSDNWASISKTLSDRFRVITVDLRNHGESFHHPAHTYPEMAADIIDLMDSLDLDEAVLVGHSMGGKVVLQLTQLIASRIRSAVVVDILPIAYPPHHDAVFAALTAIDLAGIKTRNDADRIMAAYLPDPALRGFLLKGLVSDGAAYKWKYNLDALISEYPNILRAPVLHRIYQGPVVFIMGEVSEYWIRDREIEISNYCAQYVVKTVPGAGHPHGSTPAWAACSS